MIGRIMGGLPFSQLNDFLSSAARCSGVSSENQDPHPARIISDRIRDRVEIFNFIVPNLQI